MSDSLDRRTLLKGAAVAAVAIGSIGEGAAAFPDGLAFAEPVAFSYDLFKAQAREKAHGPYVAPPHPAPEVVQKINYEEWGKIRYRSDHALFADGPGRFPVEFFHLGLFFQKAVDFHVIDGGQSRKIVYDQSYFDMPANSVARQLPQGAGFAGFRIQEARDGALDWRKNDWVAFLGAAYFRAIGELRQYGLSARGVALDVAVADRPEEFPDFTQFYIDSKESEDTVVLYALMEGPSIVGVYRFALQRGKGVVMDIEATLFMRAAVSRFGIAPLTSMYWFSETKKETAIDWRPEVHDSDGLSMWSGNGERLWRPLNNPPRIMVSAFSDNNPRGFGLCQRDRVFDHYLDGVFYDRRPTLWVEPLPDPDGRGLGQGIDPALRNSDRRRNSRQCRGDVGAGKADSGRRRAEAELPPALARRRALSAQARALRRHAAGARRPARPAAPEGRAQVRGGVSGRTARDPALRGQARNGGRPLRAARCKAIGSSKPSPTTCPATGAPNSTSRSMAGSTRSKCAVSCRPTARR